MQLLIVGLLNIPLLLNPNLESARKRLGKVGGWMRLTSKSKENGVIITAPSIKKDKQSISFCQRHVTPKQRLLFSRKQSRVAENLRRLMWIKVVLIWQVCNRLTKNYLTQS